jgi:hypothetical protein
MLLEILHTGDWFTKQKSFEVVTLEQGKIYLLPELFAIFTHT